MIRQLLLLFCLEILQGHCSLRASYTDGLCPSFICEGTAREVEWTISPEGEDFLVPLFVSAANQVDSNIIGGSPGTATYTPNGNNFTSTLIIATESLVNASITCRSSLNLNDVFGRLTVQQVFAPPPPAQFMQLTQQSSGNSVDVLLEWDAPDNGGADILDYSVTIFPAAQLSSSVVTSPSVTVSAANVNVQYTLEVVATNCVGMSATGQYNFTIGRCPIPLAPVDGSIGVIPSRTVGSTVTFQCDVGFEPAEQMAATCRNDMTWSPDPTTFTCAQRGLQSVTLSVMELAIGVVAIFIVSLLVGLVVGGCTCYLIMKRRRPLAMDQINRLQEADQYDQVETSTWNSGANTAYVAKKPAIHNIAQSSTWNTGLNTAYGAGIKHEPQQYSNGLEADTGAIWNTGANTAYNARETSVHWSNEWSTKANSAYSASLNISMELKAIGTTEGDIGTNQAYTAIKRE